AAQSAEIGVAEADFYPHISITGTIGYSSERFKNLFRSPALAGTFGPSFQWNILNYGRILNNVRLQDARFQELVAAYQSAVLTALPGQCEPPAAGGSAPAPPSVPDRVPPQPT